MTPKKKTPAKRGRKPAEADEKLEQLTIRLPPKLKFGLDLLARAQHRSLSQAVEWALQVGLNSYEVGNEITPLGDVVDEAWTKQSESERLMYVFYRAPALLAFEDFAACELVDRSAESFEFLEEEANNISGMNLYHAKRQAAGMSGLPDADPNIAEFGDVFEKYKLEKQRLTALYQEFFTLFWPAIKKVAVQRANVGKSTRNVSLLHLLGFSDILKGGRISTWEAMARAIEHVKAEEAAGAAAK